jgi:hypothetical protein
VSASVKSWLCESELAAADLLYLFCTCTGAFCRFLPIERIEFSKSFDILRIVADRLPPPPYPSLPLGLCRRPGLLFEPVQDFLKLPEGATFGEVPAIAVDSKGDIYVSRGRTARRARRSDLAPRSCCETA